MKIGIIGGGAAGLGAAYELGLHGHTAHVFEGAPFLGGQASTFDVGGTPVEKGYHHLFRSDTAMINLMNELGIGDRLKWIDSNVGYFVEDQLWQFTSPITRSSASIKIMFGRGAAYRFSARNNIININIDIKLIEINFRSLTPIK